MKKDHLLSLPYHTNIINDRLTTGNRTQHHQIVKKHGNPEIDCNVKHTHK